MIASDQEAIGGIQGHHREVEAELKSKLTSHGPKATFRDCLSLIRDHASRLFDGEAAEIIHLLSGTALQSELDHIKDRVIESVMPDRSLALTRAIPFEERVRITVHHDLDSGLIWEEAPDGTRTPARTEIQSAYAQHGLWENLIPHEGLRFALRFPDLNADVRMILGQTLERRIYYWLGRANEVARGQSAIGVTGDAGREMNTAVTLAGAPLPTLLPENWHQIELARSEAIAAAKEERLALPKKSTSEDRLPSFLRRSEKELAAYSAVLRRVLPMGSALLNSLRAYAQQIVNRIIPDPGDVRRRAGIARAIGTIQFRREKDRDVILDPVVLADTGTSGPFGKVFRINQRDNGAIVGTAMFKTAPDELESPSEAQSGILGQYGEWQRDAPEDDEILWPDVALRMRTILLQSLYTSAATSMNQFLEEGLFESVAGPATEALSPSIEGQAMPSATVGPASQTDPDLTSTAALTDDVATRTAASRGGRPRGTKVNGPFLKECRGTRSQPEFAEICEVTVGTIQRGESGRTWSEETFQKVATGIRRWKPNLTVNDIKNLNN